MFFSLNSASFIGTLGPEICLSWGKGLLFIDMKTLFSMSPYPINDNPSEIFFLFLVSVEVLGKNLNKMKLSIQQLEREIENSKTDAQGEHFISTMLPFRDLAQREWHRISKDFTELQDSFVTIADYFCFNPHKYTMEDMFQDVSTFLNQLNTACEENRRETETGLWTRGSDIPIYQISK